MKPSKTLTLARDLQRHISSRAPQLVRRRGPRSVDELVRSSLSIRGALSWNRVLPTRLAAPYLLETLPRTAKIPTDEVGPHEFQSAAETWTRRRNPGDRRGAGETPGGPPAVRSGPNSRAGRRPGPGNVGTILRTAAAMGITATFSLPGTVDLWNAKVVRSGMGAHFPPSPAYLVPGTSSTRSGVIGTSRSGPPMPAAG